MPDADCRLSDLQAIEALDSRGRPTLLCRARLRSGQEAFASVPSGASTGSREAVEKRDGDARRFLGEGVLQAVAAVNAPIRSALLGTDVREQAQIDRIMLELDGTCGKSNLGANALLVASLACLRLAAVSEGRPLYEWVAGLCRPALPPRMPVPMFNVINGGAHANNSLDVQEFMVLPCGTESFAEAVRAGAEIYQRLKQAIAREGLSTAVGDEGGFAPEFTGKSSVRAALDLLLRAVEQAGYSPGEEVFFGLDVAASELYSNGRYLLPGEQLETDAAGFCDWLSQLAQDYPIRSIEDGMDEDDRAGWQLLTKRLGRQVQLVGDDLFVTSAASVRQGASQALANAILIKPNQAGTVTETLQALAAAAELDYAAVVSHRSGDTEDTTVADLTVGSGAGQCKFGAPCRSERTAKYNRLLWLEQESSQPYAGAAALAPTASGDGR